MHPIKLPMANSMRLFLAFLGITASFSLLAHGVDEDTQDTCGFLRQPIPY
jgi:hypothetical protein